MQVIQPENPDGRFAGIGQREDDWPVSLKVVEPNLLSGIEQPNCVSVFSNQRCHVRAFVPVADRARQSKIVHAGSTTMFSAYDVIDLQSVA